MRITAIIFLFGLLASCQTPKKMNSGQHYNISEADLSILPNNNKEKLVFVSSANDTLTLFASINKDTIGSDPWAKNPDYFDRVTYAVAPHKNDATADGAFAVVLIAKREQDLSIEFKISLNDIVFYGPDYFSRKQFADIPLTTFTVGTHTFNDVKILEGNGRFKERDNYVQTVYWSQGHGFLGFDKKTIRWRRLFGE